MIVDVEFPVNISMVRDNNKNSIILSASVEFPESLLRFGHFDQQAILHALQTSLTEARIKAEGSSAR